MVFLFFFLRFSRSRIRRRSCCGVMSASDFSCLWGASWDASCAFGWVGVEHAFLVEVFIVLVNALFRFGAADLLTCCVCKSEKKAEQEQRIAIRKQKERQNKTKLEYVSYLGWRSICCLGRFVASVALVSGRASSATILRCPGIWHIDRHLEQGMGNRNKVSKKKLKHIKNKLPFCLTFLCHGMKRNKRHTIRIFLPP